MEDYSTCITRKTIPTCWKIFNKNYLTSLYFIVPLVAGIVNPIVKAYSFWINKKLDHLPIFTIESASKTEDKFSLSLESSISITTILFSAFSDFSNREIRLKFFFSLQTMFLSVFLPVVLISKNEKMKHLTERQSLAIQIIC